MKQLRCGVIGLGRGRKFVDALNAIDTCEVAAVCDTRPEALEAFSGLATHTEVEAFLAEGLDVVAVITPGPAHAEQSVAAMRSGAHVVCETPCVYSLDEARSVVKAAQESGRLFMLAENYLWIPWLEPLRRMAEEGRFGRVAYAEGDYTHDCRPIMVKGPEGWVPRSEWGKRPDAKPTWRATHLPPLLYCSHTLGPLLAMMGDRVTSAFGLAVRGRGAPGVVDTDLETGLFETESGAVIRLTNGFAVGHPLGFYFNIVGDKGSAKTLRANDQVTRVYSELDGGGPQQWREVPPNEDDVATERVMLEGFIKAVLGEAPPPIDLHRSMDMTLPGIVAHASAQQGGAKLPVPDSRDW